VTAAVTRKDEYGEWVHVIISLRNSVDRRAHLDAMLNQVMT